LSIYFAIFVLQNKSNMSTTAVQKDPTGPASKRQLWALFCATKQDYRDTKITYGEASALLEAANHDRPAKPTKKSVRDQFREHFLSDQNVNRMYEKMTQEMGIKSVVTNDPKFMAPGKSYLFLGGGCGFSHIYWDKRNKLGGEIMEEFSALRKQFEKKLLQKFDRSYLADLQKSGNPIEAHLFQNLSYNTSLNYIVSGFMESQGVKGVRVTSMYD
jgi:hypothetical protein